MVSMSIIKKRFSAALIVFAAITLFACVAPAQKIEAHIKITSSASVNVEGRFIKENTNQKIVNWSFTNSIAGVENLGARISEFNLSDENNQPVAFVKLTDGEYLASVEAAAFRYQVNLSLPAEANAMAHVSWLDDDKGVLMLGDLLPQSTANNKAISARIKIDLPTDWKIISSEKNTGENTFEIKNVEKAVFLVGKNWRERELIIGKTDLSLAIAGEWQFSDEQALSAAGEIYEEYVKLFGEAPTDKTQIALIRFPSETKFGRWAAETRGANVTILSADMPFVTQSAQRLHEQLRHEIFHLWMPNRLALTGNYDWFYEGFTVYQALRTGVALNRIRFEDYLDTLAEAYNLDNLQNGKVSLLESSKNRWSSGASRQVYARGMLAAFLCDVALLGESRGRRSIAEVFREIYRRHRAPNKPEEGNAAILKILKNYSELNSVVEKYIAGAEKISWETNLESLGIEANEENLTTTLGVKKKLNGKQKDLLNELGYNNWRRLSDKRK
jgi:predicted metalloprotease with PDZ domain